MEIVRELSVWVFLCSGAAFCVVGAIGLLRFPDVYSRMHASGLIDTAGAGLILVGLTFEPAHWTAVVKLLVIVFFLYMTSATASHALAHAAFTSGLEPFGSSETDEDPRP